MNDSLHVTEQEREFFWSGVAIKGPDDCWHWTRATQKPGPRGKLLPYGWCRFRGEGMNTHRVAWMIANDRAIGPNLQIRHSCHVPQCCNPRHLSTGTAKENAADMMAAGRHRPGNGLGRTAPHVTLEEAQRMAKAGARSIMALSAMTGRSPSTIRNVFKKFNLELPNRRRTDDQWRAMAAHDLPTFAEYMSRFNVGIDNIRKQFTRLGLKLPDYAGSESDYVPPYPDDHWRDIADADYPTMAAAMKATRHTPRTIRKNLTRLGLPVPPPRPTGRPRHYLTTPTNPTKGAD